MMPIDNNVVNDLHKKNNQFKLGSWDPWALTHPWLQKDIIRFTCTFENPSALRLPVSDLWCHPWLDLAHQTLCINKKQNTRFMFQCPHSLKFQWRSHYLLRIRMGQGWAQGKKKKTEKKITIWGQLLKKIQYFHPKKT